jgi:hypothetical protein
MPSSARTLSLHAALERGHSKQAPAGIVAVTVEELKLISDRLATQIADGKDQ